MKIRLLLLLTGIMFIAQFSYCQEVDTTTFVDEYYENAEEDSVASTTPVDPQALKSIEDYKSEKITIRKFDEDKWQKIAGDKDYNETERKKQTQQEASAPWGGVALKIAGYAIIIGLVVFILYLIINNTYLDSKIKNKTQISTNAAKTVEDIHELDIQSLLQQAMANGELRLVVRLYYLRLLKKLDENKLIAWRKEKTNHDYLMELFSREWYKEVRGLTNSYEKCWYGEHDLDNESYQKLVAAFEDIHQRLSKVTTS